MQTYPLDSLTVAEAKGLQFKLVDIITKHFQGREVLSLGDLGLVAGQNKPVVTLQVEQVLAEFFEAEAAVLLQGAGTGAIRWGLYSMIKANQILLVHDATLYPTTEIIAESMGLRLIRANYNCSKELTAVLQSNAIDGALIQYTRQKMDDRYDIKQVIQTIKQHNQAIPIITDDNYAVMKVRHIGVQCGADMSAFSLFKLLGPEGVGCVVGSQRYIDKINRSNYSGGGQIQGHHAMEALRGLIYAPVSLAIQAEVNDELVQRLLGGEVAGVKNAFLANAQSKVLLVELDKPIAKQVITIAETMGAAPHPVGAESKYEFVPMFYRVSGTFIAADPTLSDRMIRINPMRSGADTIIRILRQAIEDTV